MSEAFAAAATRPARRKPPAGEKRPDDILFQTYFKSVGPRTYAAQMKRAGNGNHYLVFTEGQRDAGTGEVRKTRLFVYGEDFVAFFKMLKETAEFVRAHPVPADVAAKRQRHWKREAAIGSPGRTVPRRGRLPLTVNRPVGG